MRIRCIFHLGHHHHHLPWSHQMTGCHTVTVSILSWPNSCTERFRYQPVQSTHFPNLYAPLSLLMGLAQTTLIFSHAMMISWQKLMQRSLGMCPGKVSQHIMMVLILTKSWSGWLQATMSGTMTPSKSCTTCLQTATSMATSTMLHSRSLTLGRGNATETSWVVTGPGMRQTSSLRIQGLTAQC